MSWIGGLNDSLNQFTSKAGQLGGQLSSFTKEVLSETTDEEIDFEADVKALKVKLIDAEATVNQQQAQIANQQKSIFELEEQCRRSELDAHSRVCQYEAKLEQQAKLLSKLKHENVSEGEFQVVTGSESFGIGNRRTFSGSSPDAAEFADVISYQQEIARLLEELELSKEEKERWKAIAEKPTSTFGSDDGAAQVKVKELELRLHEAIDRHQHEYLALQQANSTTVQQLQDQIRILRSQVTNDDRNLSIVSFDEQQTQKQDLLSLRSELDEYKEKLRTKNRQLQAQKKSIEELRGSLKDQEKLKEEVKSLTSDLVCANKQKEECVAEIKKLDLLRKGICEIVCVNDDVTSHETIINHVRSLRNVRDNYHDEIEDMKKKLEHMEKEKYEIIDSLNESVVISKEKAEKASQENTTDEMAQLMHVNKLMPMYQSSPAVEKSKKPEEKFLIVSSDDASAMSPGEVTQALHDLQRQVEEYELEIAEYGIIRAEWEQEKQALQSVLDQYEQKSDKNSNDKATDSQKTSVLTELQQEIRELQTARVNMEKDKLQLLQEKDQLQAAILNLQDELNHSISETQTERDRFTTLEAELKNALSDKSELETLVNTVTEQLDNSKMENTELGAELIALDEQHQDEMNQILVIKDELNKKLKESDHQYQTTSREFDELREQHQTVCDEMTKLKTNSENAEEMRTVLDEKAAVMEEKQVLENKLSSAFQKLQISNENLSKMEEKLSNLEKKCQDYEADLDKNSSEKTEAEEKLSNLELNHRSLTEALQTEFDCCKDALQKSTDEANLLMKQVEKAETEHQASISKLEEQREVLDKALAEISLLQDLKQNLESEFVFKDTEITSLKSELQLLRDENKKRVEQLTKQSDTETAASDELTTIKNELLHTHNQLEVSETEKRELNGQIQDMKQKLDSITQDLGNKEKEIIISSQNLDEVTSKFNLKLEELKNNYEGKLEAMDLRQQNELLELQDSYNNQIESLEDKLLEAQKHLSLLEDEKSTLKHENSGLHDKIKFIEQELSEEFDKTQEKMQQSTEEHEEQMKELKSVIEKLTKELNQQVALVESLEEENKRQLELQEDKNLKNEQEFSHLHSAALNEKNHLRTAYDLEKEELKQKHEKEIKKLTEDFQGQLEKLKENHSEKLSTALTELKETHQADRDALKDRIHYLENDIKGAETELIQAQNELKLLSQHCEKQEQKWRQETSEKLEKLKMTHQKEMLELQAETDELIQQNMHQSDTNSINSELVQSQIMQLQDENQNLYNETENLKSSFAKVQENLEMKQNEIIGLNQQISGLSDQRNSLETELKNLKETHLKLLESRQSEQDTPPEAQKRKIELLKQQDLNQGISTSCPNLTQVLDLEGVEKSDLSKEDISSLLAVIKERDVVIGTLRTKNNELISQIKAKASAEADGRVNQLIEEKEQMLNVISEKTKENRQLKDELHKMVDVIAAEKNALSKVHEENQALISKYEGFDQEMNRETVARLSKLISEKDLEIESLRQKCQTLLDVLQQQEQRQGSTESKAEAQVPAQQVQALLRDRETLSQQVRQLLAERDHLVALVNTKHQEALLFQERAQKAADSLEQDAAENSRLQILYSNLVHDYEQVELRLSTVQKEVAKFKESLNHMEETKDILFSKLGADDISRVQQNSQMLDVMENLRSDSSKSAGGKTKEDLERIVEKNSEALLQKDVFLQENSDKLATLEKQIGQLHRDIREKDILIHQKTNKSKQISEDLAQKSNEVGILRRSVENLREQVSGSNHDVSSLNERLESAERLANEKESEAQAFQETNAQLSVMLKEREYELEALREKVVSVTELLQQQEQGKNYETKKYLQELDRAKEQATLAKHERDQIMLTLKQKQMETQRSGEEARQLRDKEAKLQSELSRLRSHLVQVEETYTQEAVLSSERELSLRERLEQIQSKNASAVEANEMSMQQLESLQEQVRSATKQRDQALHNFQLAKEQSSQYAGALQQLQMAAERMQREEAATYAARVDKINQQYKVRVDEVNTLTQQLTELKLRFDEANAALESASRLNQQLEVKEESINYLKKLVSEKQLEIEEIQDELHKINAKSDHMVDRQLVKNLLIGYFNSPANKQPDVIRLITSMIGFSKEEELKLHPTKKGWVSGWLPWGGGESPEMKAQHQKDLNESFTGMFVKFLENESSAKQPIAKLPAAAMINEAQQRMNQRKNVSKLLPTPGFQPTQRHSTPPERSTVAGRYNPFLASASTGDASSTGPSHPLMQPLGSSLPTFNPLANPKTSERDILKGILDNSSSSAS